MTGPCIVWACPRPADADGTFCPRHAPHADPLNDTALALAWDVEYLTVGEGLTLAEVAALT